MLRQHNSRPDGPVILSRLLMVYSICSYRKQRDEEKREEEIQYILSLLVPRWRRHCYLISCIWARQESFSSAKLMKVWTFTSFKKKPHKSFSFFVETNRSISVGLVLIGKQVTCCFLNDTHSPLILPQEAMLKRWQKCQIGGDCWSEWGISQLHLHSKKCNHFPWISWSILPWNSRPAEKVCLEWRCTHMYRCCLLLQMNRKTLGSKRERLLWSTLYGASLQKLKEKAEEDTRNSCLGTLDDMVLWWIN